jgi:hypothetical protein
LKVQAHERRPRAAADIDLASCAFQSCHKVRRQNKQVDRHAVQSRIKQAAPNKKQPVRHAPPPPKEIGVTGIMRGTIDARPPVFTSVEPAPADAVQLANRAVVKGGKVEIVAADEVNSIDRAAAPLRAS